MNSLIKRWGILFLIVAAAAGFAYGCGSAGWKDFGSFFGGLNRVRSLDDVKSMLDGQDYQYTKSDTGEIFSVEGLCVWGTDWDTSIDVAADADSISVFATLSKTFAGEKEAAAFLESAKSQLTAEFGEGLPGTSDYGGTHTLWILEEEILLIKQEAERPKVTLFYQRVTRSE
jgi:hypothetical protein